MWKGSNKKVHLSGQQAGHHRPRGSHEQVVQPQAAEQAVRPRQRRRPAHLSHAVPRLVALDAALTASCSVQLDAALTPHVRRMRGASNEHM